MNVKTTVEVILAAAVFQMIATITCLAGQFTPAQWTELAGEVASARTNGQHSTYAAWVRVTTQPLTNTVVEVVSTNRKPKLVAAENRYKNVLSSFGLTTADSFDDIYGTISALQGSPTNAVVRRANRGMSRISGLREIIRLHGGNPNGATGAANRNIIVRTKYYGPYPLSWYPPTNAVVTVDPDDIKLIERGLKP